MVGNSNTLKIFFPGIRYSIDRSLLHFIDKYVDGDSIYIDYSSLRSNDGIVDFDEEVKNDVALSLEKLKNVKWDSYGEIILIGKSIGTVVASIIRKELKLDRARFICLTPLTQTVPYLRQTDFIVSSKLDQYIDISLLEKKQFLFPLLTIYQDLPHSLELDNNYHRTFEVLNGVIDLTLNYLDTAYKDLLG